jgi:hypothetical protein
MYYMGNQYTWVSVNNYTVLLHVIENSELYDYDNCVSKNGDT